MMTPYTVETFTHRFLQKRHTIKKFQIALLMETLLGTFANADTTEIDLTPLSNLSIVDNQVEAASIDLSQVFAKLHLDSIHFSNQTEKSYTIDVVSNCVSMTGQYTPFTTEETKNLTPGCSFYHETNGYFDSIAGIKWTSSENPPSLLLGIDKDSNRLMLTLSNDASCPLSIPVDQNYVSTPVHDLDSMEYLYRKYFLNDDQTLTPHDVWWNFSHQVSGVTDTKRSQEIIISLTSYPARFKTTWLAIESLLRQDEKPDRIVLNLFEGEFPNRVLPWFIRKQMERGLEIIWYPDNLKVYLKAIPAIEKFPDAAIVVFDDDVIYPKNRLKDLIDGYNAHPNCVICSDGRHINIRNDYILPVNKWTFSGWQLESEASYERFDIVPEGVFGILFPPHSLHPLYFARQDLYRELAPSDDDAWNFTMAIINKKKIYKVARPRQSDKAPLINIEDTQDIETSLWKVNFANNGSRLNEQFSNLYHHFNLSAIFDTKNNEISLSEYKKSIDKSTIQYDTFVPFNSITLLEETPIELISGFSNDELDGVWGIGGESVFKMHAPDTQGMYRLVFEGHPYLNPHTQRSDLHFISETSVEPLSSYTLNQQKEYRLSCVVCLSKNEELFSIKTPHFVNQKALQIGNIGDDRDLSFFFKRFAAYKISACEDPIHINANLPLNAPIVLKNGFYDLEPNGVWSKNKAEFNLAFPKIDTSYTIRIAAELFGAEGPCQMYNESTLLWEHENNLRNHNVDILFHHYAHHHLGHFTILVMNPLSPREVSSSQDDRKLGIFLKEFKIEQIN